MRNYPLLQGGAAVDDMKQKAQQLQAQLRGLISDYQARPPAAAAAAAAAAAGALQHSVGRKAALRCRAACVLGCGTAARRGLDLTAGSVMPLPLAPGPLALCRAATRPSSPRPLKPLTCSAAAWRS